MGGATAVNKKEFSAKMPGAKKLPGRPSSKKKAEMQKQPKQAAPAAIKTGLQKTGLQKKAQKQRATKVVVADTQISFESSKLGPLLEVKKEDATEINAAAALLFGLMNT